MLFSVPPGIINFYFSVGDQYLSKKQYGISEIFTIIDAVQRPAVFVHWQHFLFLLAAISLVPSNCSAARRSRTPPGTAV
jgi:hypothetical protein